MITPRKLEQPPVPPMTVDEIHAAGWDELDVLLVSGDACIDHPACGPALLARLLISRGYRTAIFPQPDWRTPADLTRLGRPRLFAGVTAGSMDSMLAHYTPFRKKRSDDAYTPGGQAGARPNRASLVYSNLVRQVFPGLPVILGGIEASMRRAVHYDFWSDSIRRPLLVDSKASLLVYGMAESALLEICQRLEQNGPGADLSGIPGTVETANAETLPISTQHECLPSFSDIQADPRKLMPATLRLEQQCREGGAALTQVVDNRLVILHPPAAPLQTAELDTLYTLPFTRRAHPSYHKPVPAETMLKFSLTTHRGCAGGCTFCAITMHQGRQIQSRSARSIQREVRHMTRHPDWKGSVSDIGGPSANMWGAHCRKEYRNCHRPSCLWPARCPDFIDAQQELAALLLATARTPGVKHLRTASGVRFDLALRNAEYIKVLLKNCTGGQLKLAPEHNAAQVLRLMRKPPFHVFETFLKTFEADTQQRQRPQYVLPYLISAFPGCTDHDMRRLAHWLNARGWRPQQVQCFTPTPGTIATAMFAGGIDPGGNPIPVARSDAERMRQHRLLTGQWSRPTTTPPRSKKSRAKP